MKKYFFLFLVLLNFLFSSRSKGNQSDRILGLWVGAYSNEVFKFPNPIIYDFKTDGIVTKIYVNQNFKKVELKWQIEDSILIIDTIKYRIAFLNDKKLKLNNDETGLGFIKINEGKINLSNSQINKILTSGNWLKEETGNKDGFNKEEFYRFNENQLVINRNYYNNFKNVLTEKESYFFNFFRYQNSIFLLKTVESLNFGTYSLPVDFLTDIHKNSFSCINSFSNQHLKFKKIKKIKSTENYEVFKVCFENFIPQYFNIGTQYLGGNKRIKEYYLRNYVSPSDSSCTGYCSIRFIVNCEGKIGRYKVEEFNEEYQPMKLNPKISNQLLLLLLGLNDWIPGKDGNGVAMDSYKFLTFKIEKGEIKDILP